MTQTTTVLIAEDKKIFREALARELANLGIVTIGEAANGRELMDLLEHTNPSVVLIDTEMPIMDGEETLAQIRRKYPTQPVIMLGDYKEFIFTDYFLKCGARAYLSKDYASANMRLFAALIEDVKNGAFISQVHTAHSPVKPAPIFQTNQAPSEDDKATAARMGIVLRDAKELSAETTADNALLKASGFFKHTFGKGLSFLTSEKNK